MKRINQAGNKARRQFLKKALAAFALTFAMSGVAVSAVGEPEKEDLKFGFIKLTDMAPLAIAYEKGYFEDEGLYVTLEAQANWKV
ncbi:MAG: ABC transporter substrate-binding protein, partial [Chromatiales bacterium]